MTTSGVSRILMNKLINLKIEDDTGMLDTLANLVLYDKGEISQEENNLAEKAGIKIFTFD